MSNDSNIFRFRTVWVVRRFLCLGLNTKWKILSLGSFINCVQCGSDIHLPLLRPFDLIVGGLVILRALFRIVWHFPLTAAIPSRQLFVGTVNTDGSGAAAWNKLNCYYYPEMNISWSFSYNIIEAGDEWYN